ncbi:MAG TPA: DUF2933 domain-containing protein [Vicinamibacterales bacterium]|nr:DUF2933 domain-containing protein [Vicinamibacterales bacterium]
MSHEHSTGNRSGRLGAISKIAFLGFAAIAGYFLVTEHRAHLFGILPFLLLAACPLLHVFHHRGHGRSEESGKGSGAGGGEHRH